MEQLLKTIRGPNKGCWGMKLSLCQLKLVHTILPYIGVALSTIIRRLWAS